MKILEQILCFCSCTITVQDNCSRSSFSDFAIDVNLVIFNNFSHCLNSCISCSSCIQTKFLLFILHLFLYEGKKVIVKLYPSLSPLVIYVYTRSVTKRKRVLDPRRLSLWRNKLYWLRSKYIAFDPKIMCY